MLGHEYDEEELLREFEEDLGISTHPFELSLASNLSLQREKLMGADYSVSISSARCDESAVSFVRRSISQIKGGGIPKASQIVVTNFPWQLIR